MDIVEGLTIGKNPIIRTGFIFEPVVEIGDDFETGYYVVLRKGVKVGDSVRIWSQTVVDPNTVIGNRVKIHNLCYICQGTIIEDDVFIAPSVSLGNDKYPPRYDSTCWEPPIIKNGAIIGIGATILPGVTIGERAIIGGGSVVVKSVPPGQVWLGNPARRVR